jgi:HEAT repeat protein
VGAALALRRCGVEPREYLQVLIEGTRAEYYRGMNMTRGVARNDGVRVAAIEALGEMGAAARAALPVLHVALDDRSAAVRAAARATIACLR